MQRIILNEKDYTYDVLHDGSVVIYMPSDESTAKLDVVARVLSKIIGKEQTDYAVDIEPYVDTIKPGFIDGEYRGEIQRFYIKTETASITENGTYTPSEDRLISLVNVNVPQRQLYAPTISIANNKELTIVDNSNGLFVDSYDIYANGEVVTNVSDISSAIDLTEIIDATGIYTITVKAVGHGMADSDSSNTQQYIVYEQLATPTISITNDVLYISAIPHASEYKIYADGDTYSFVLNTTSTTVDLEQWLESYYDAYAIVVQAIGETPYTNSEESSPVIYIYAPRASTPSIAYAPLNVGGIIAITDTTQQGGIAIESYNIYKDSAFYGTVSRTATVTNASLDIDDFSIGNHTIYVVATATAARDSNRSNNVSANVYGVSYNVSHGSIDADAPNKAWALGTVQVTITPDVGYVTPFQFNIVGAQLYSYDIITGEVTLNYVNNAVTLTTSCEVPIVGATVQLSGSTLLITSEDERIEGYKITSDNVAIDIIERDNVDTPYSLDINDFSVGTHSVVVYSLPPFYEEGYDAPASSPLSVIVYSVTYTIVGGRASSGAPTKLFSGTPLSTYIQADSGYALPSTITLTGATLQVYRQSDGYISTGIAISNIIIQATCLEKLGKSTLQSIDGGDYVFNNVEHAERYIIYIDNRAVDTITAQSGTYTRYALPLSLSVATHRVSNVAQADGYVDGDRSADVNFSIYSIRYSIGYGSASSDSPTKVIGNNTFTAKIVPNQGYVYPATVSIDGGTLISYDSNTGTLTATATGTVTVSAVCGDVLPTPVITISDNMLMIAYSGVSAQFKIRANGTTIVTTSNTSYNLDSIDMATPGTYNITVVATASGYADSQPSNTVQYFLGWYYPIISNGVLTITQAYLTTQDNARIMVR